MRRVRVASLPVLGASHAVLGTHGSDPATGAPAAFAPTNPHLLRRGRVRGHSWRGLDVLPGPARIPHGLRARYLARHHHGPVLAGERRPTRRCSRPDASVAALPRASAAERLYRWADGRHVRDLKDRETRMLSVRVIVESEVDTLAAVFPEKGLTPINRHVDRFARQRRGEITCLAAWEDGVPVGYVFLRWPGSSDATVQARSLACVELGDLAVAEQARERPLPSPWVPRCRLRHLRFGLHLLGPRRGTSPR
jgi:hypothetical protein